jgi:hypothetical protein
MPFCNVNSMIKLDIRNACFKPFMWMKSIFACYGMSLFHFLVFFLFTRFLHDVQKNVSVKKFTLILALFLRGLQLVHGVYIYTYTPSLYIYTYIYPKYK